jgi:hypothetical protein
MLTEMDKLVRHRVRVPIPGLMSDRNNYLLTLFIKLMDRKAFARKLALLGVCPFVIQNLSGSEPATESLIQEDKLQALQSQKQFVENWLSDLLDSMGKLLDRETQERIVGNCGKACFNRFQFKKDIAINGSGDLDKLIKSYRKNFEIWKEGATVHIRYGEVSKGCYCPAANYRTPKPDDIHCECTRTTHQTIFETALGKSFKVDIAESVRRGGKTCHFIVHLS